MSLSLELGQVADDHARRALEQISLRWPDPPRVPLVTALPGNAALGAVVFLTTPTAGLYVLTATGWKRA